MKGCFLAEFVLMFYDLWFHHKYRNRINFVEKFCDSRNMDSEVEREAKSRCDPKIIENFNKIVVITSKLEIHIWKLKRRIPLWTVSGHWKIPIEIILWDNVNIVSKKGKNCDFRRKNKISKWQKISVEHLYKIRIVFYIKAQIESIER